MAKNSKQRSLNNTVEVSPLDNLRQNERIDRVIDLIVRGKSKRQITDSLSQEWECTPRTVETIIKEAMIQLTETQQMSKEEVRTLSNVRLEGVWEQAATVNQKVKVIDLINKTNNIYDNNIMIGQKDNSFHFDIGVDISDPECYDDVDGINEQE